MKVRAGGPEHLWEFIFFVNILYSLQAGLKGHYTLALQALTKAHWFIVIIDNGLPNQISKLSPLLPSLCAHTPCGCQDQFLSQSRPNDSAYNMLVIIVSTVIVHECHVCFFILDAHLHTYLQ